MGWLVELPRQSKMGKLPPKRILNYERCSREYLTIAKVEAMIAAGKTTGMYGHQDATLTFLAYRHASCVSELVAGVGTRWTLNRVFCK